MEASETVSGAPEYEPIPVLIPCLLCNRKFLPESLVRHKKACEKVLMKKRKQFDSAKQRLTGELAECLPLPPAKLKRASPARKSSRWKEKHLELLETLRAARVGVNGAPAPLLSKPVDHEQCPYCGRSFGPKAFDRHEEYCREKFSRLEHRPKMSTEAKERLEARTKYRAPCVKSKRSITREKYLPANMKREPSPGSNAVKTSTPVTKPEPKLALPKQNSINTKENDAKATTVGSNFVRASRNTSSFRASQRRPSKPSPVSTRPSPVTTKPQPLAPKPMQNNRTEPPNPPIRQNLHTLPSNMKIKKDTPRSSTAVKKIKQPTWDPSVIYGDTSDQENEDHQSQTDVENTLHHQYTNPNEEDCRTVMQINKSDEVSQDNVSDLIDLSTPRLEGEENVYTAYAPKYFDQNVFFTEEQKTPSLNFLEKVKMSDTSSSDSGVGSFDLREMRKQCSNNDVNLNCVSPSKKTTNFFSSDLLTAKATSNRLDEKSVRRSTNYRETFEQGTEQNEQTPRSNSSHKHDGTPRNIAMNQSQSEKNSQKLFGQSEENGFDLNESSTSQSSTGEMMSTYRQATADYNSQICDFINNAFKKSASQTTLTSKKSSLERGSKRERKVLADSDVTNTSDLGILETLGKKGRSKKSKKKSSKRKKERRKTVEREVKVHLVNGGSGNAKAKSKFTISNVEKDLSDQSRYSEQPRDDPYDSLEDEKELPSQISNQEQLYEIFSNDHYVHEDDSSSITETELVAIADRMNRISNKTHRSELCQTSEPDSGNITDLGTLKSKINSEYKNLLPLRNAKKNHNLLELADNEVSKVSVVIDTIQTVEKGVIKTGKSKASPKLGKKPLSDLKKDKKPPRSGRKDNVLPPIVSKQNFKQKAPEVTKRGSNTTTLPPIVKQRTGSKIPQSRTLAVKKKLPESSLKNLNLTKHNNLDVERKNFPLVGAPKTLDVEKIRWKSPVHELPAININESKEKSKVEDEEIPKVFELPEVTDEISRESIKSADITTSTSRVHSISNLNTSLQKLLRKSSYVDSHNSEEVPKSPYANSTMQEDSLFSEGKNSNGSKASGDSAYNSLNRKATDEHTSSNSSSGSESSFPRPHPTGPKLSKFCHECGSQYVLATAKFCCQCGVRRLSVA